MIRKSYLPTWLVKYVMPLKKLLRPQLGLLYQYPPKPVKLPKYYYKSIKTKSLPPISLVTPSFNQGEFIERTIQSVLRQNYPHLQYIIQDGDSTDQTKNILKKYHSNLAYWESKVDTGQSNAINLGFQHATGDIMAYLNSDDILLPNSLNYIGDYFAKHPQVDVIYGHRILIDMNDQEIGRWVLPPHSENILTVTDFIPQETLFWRRSIWDKAGGKIDENFHFAMDWDLILRFKEAGARFKRLPRFLGAFRVHSQQKTLTQISDIGEKEMAFLQSRYHHRPLSKVEIRRKTQFYLKSHVVLNWLYGIGILK